MEGEAAEEAVAVAGSVEAEATLEVATLEAKGAGALVVEVPMAVMESTMHTGRPPSAHWGRLKRMSLPRRKMTPNQMVPHRRRQIG